LRFVQAINIGDPQALAETLALWSAGESPPRERLLLAAEQLVARHGGTRLVLATLVNDFFALMRQERLTVPPDLLLIFKALVTIDGVLANIAPGFDLTLALRQAAVRIIASRLDPAAWTPVLQGLLLEITRIGQDGPRLLRLIIERLERDQFIAAQPGGTEIAAAGRWIAGAIVAGSLILAAAVALF
jgi:ubiquinone biosynthesis protein